MNKNSTLRTPIAIADGVVLLAAVLYRVLPPGFSQRKQALPEQVIEVLAESNHWDISLVPGVRQDEGNRHRVEGEDQQALLQLVLIGIEA